MPGPANLIRYCTYGEWLDMRRALDAANKRADLQTKWGEQMAASARRSEERLRKMTKTTKKSKPKAKPATPDRDALVEISSLLTLAHVLVARALTLAQAAGFEAIVTETKTIAESIRREAAVAISSATKGDG